MSENKAKVIIGNINKIRSRRQRAGGEVLYNHMTEPMEHPARGRNWNPHGLTVSDKKNYQVVPEAKIQDLKERTVDPQAIPCIIPFVATSDLNSYMWVDLKKQLECGSIKFLVSMEKRQDELENSGEYFKLTSEELAEKLAPYGQTDLMIQEAVNLKAEFKNDKVKLTEPRSGTKDRIIVLGYGNYIASLIENEWNIQNQALESNVLDLSFIW